MTVTIKVRDNGPFVVDGDFTLTDAAGNEIPILKRALCRCGGSANKPFCDNSHSKIGFQGANAAVAEAESGSSSGSSS